MEWPALLRYRIVPAAIAAIAFSFLQGGAMAGEPPADASLVGKRIQQSRLTDSRGIEYLLPAIRDGRVDVVNFWGIRCGSCLEELPKLEALYGKYRERGVTVYGINADAAPWEALRPLMEKMNLKFSFPLFSDTQMDLMDGYQVSATPMTVILDGRGIVRYQHVGYQAGDEAKLESEILKAMEGGK